MGGKAGRGLELMKDAPASTWEPGHPPAGGSRSPPPSGPETLARWVQRLGMGQKHCLHFGEPKSYGEKLAEQHSGGHLQQ